MRVSFLHACAASLRVAVGCAPGAAETIRIAFIDPLSGPMALRGEPASHHFHALVDNINVRGGVLGGVQLEVVNFDSKLSA